MSVIPLFPLNSCRKPLHFYLCAKCWEFHVEHSRLFRAHLTCRSEEVKELDRNRYVEQIVRKN